MMIFVAQLLLLTLAIITAIANGQQQLQMYSTAISNAQPQPQMSYSPADGYYICRYEDAKCLVTGCESGGCSIIEKGFEKEITEFGKSIYKATRPGASLSIVVAKDIAATTTEVSCDGACACQWITSGIGGCVPAAPQVVKASTNTGDGQSSEAEKEVSGINNNTPVTRPILIGVLIPLCVILVAGMIWYGMRRRRRQQQEKEEEDDKSVIFEVQTHGGDSVNDDDDDDDEYRVTSVTLPPRIQINNNESFGDKFHVNDTTTGPTIINNYGGADNLDDGESVQLALKYDTTCPLYESLCYDDHA